jgi:DNA-binding NarL/FixJ family response regulator
MNGIDCLSEIRKKAKLKDVPVIIYSTTADAAHVDITYSLGANLFIKKPSNYTSIRDTINNTLSLNLKDLIPQRPKSQFLVSLE